MKIIKAWLPERRWLKANNIEFENFPEEERFQHLCKYFKLIEKAEFVRMSKSMQIVAQRLA